MNYSGTSQFLAEPSGTLTTAPFAKGILLILSPLAASVTIGPLAGGASTWTIPAGTSGALSFPGTGGGQPVFYRCADASDPPKIVAAFTNMQG